jgi:hypothetical protein
VFSPCAFPAAAVLPEEVVQNGEKSIRSNEPPQHSVTDGVIAAGDAIGLKAQMFGAE